MSWSAEFFFLAGSISVAIKVSPSDAAVNPNLLSFERPYRYLRSSLVADRKLPLMLELFVVKQGCAAIRKKAHPPLTAGPLLWSSVFLTLVEKLSCFLLRRNLLHRSADR